MDKAKHEEVRFARGRLAACRYANDRRFRKLTEWPHDLFEVHMAKRTIRMDIPSQLAFTILQNAKAHMLEFHYRFLDHFLPKSAYALLEMDTGKRHVKDLLLLAKSARGK